MNTATQTQRWTFRMKDAVLLGKFLNCQQLKRGIAEYFSCVRAALTVTVYFSPKAIILWT